MEKNYIKFSNISYKILKEIIDIKQVRSREIFNEWFNFKFEINKYDEKFLIKLIKINEYNIDFYNEYQLFGHFINPILKLVDFYGENYREWLQPEISGILNGHKIGGILDFMIASGTEEPEVPFFFIQEFKKSFAVPKHPKGQLLAQMAVAIEINKIKKIRGAYNIGKLWNFVILEKINHKKYRFHESNSFNSCKIEELKQIFINLKAVKQYCKIMKNEELE